MNIFELVEQLHIQLKPIQQAFNRLEQQQVLVGLTWSDCQKYFRNTKHAYFDCHQLKQLPDLVKFSFMTKKQKDQLQRVPFLAQCCRDMETEASADLLCQLLYCADAPLCDPWPLLYRGISFGRVISFGTDAHISTYRFLLVAECLAQHKLELFKQHFLMSRALAPRKIQEIVQELQRVQHEFNQTLEQLFVVDRFVATQWKQKYLAVSMDEDESFNLPDHKYDELHEVPIKKPKINHSILINLTEIMPWDLYHLDPITETQILRVIRNEHPRFTFNRCDCSNNDTIQSLHNEQQT